MFIQCSCNVCIMFIQYLYNVHTVNDRYSTVVGRQKIRPCYDRIVQRKLSYKIHRIDSKIRLCSSSGMQVLPAHWGAHCSFYRPPVVRILRQTVQLCEHFVLKVSLVGLFRVKALFFANVMCFEN